MAETDDVLDLDLEVLDENIDKRNKVEDRIKNLSSKVKKTAEEKAELAQANEELSKVNEEITKERDFYASFVDETSKFGDASEFKDEIRDLFKKGYSVEDATVSVLNKKGKLIPASADEAPGEQQEEKPENPAGGSATNPPPTGQEKPVEELEQADKLQALKDMEAKGELNMKRGPF